MVLTEAGHTITFAIDGEEALLRLKDDVFDIIILDVVMPRKNGYQLCREIKTTPQYKAVPVIMMTTKNQDADKFWGMRQGADEYLVKPCTEEALLEAVNKHLPVQLAAETRAPFIAEPAPIITPQPIAIAPVEPVMQEKKDETEKVPVGTGVGPLSNKLKEATGEHPALPKEVTGETPALPSEETQKKITPLKDKVQNSFYRFNN
jgi:twitching motility two-component system response regulator PilH